MRESKRWLLAACLPLISLVTTAQTQGSKLYRLQAIYPITELKKPIVAKSIPTELLLILFLCMQVSSFESSVAVKGDLVKTAK